MVLQELLGALDALVDIPDSDAPVELVSPAGFYAPLIAGLPHRDLTVVLTPSSRAAEQMVKELSTYTEGVELFPDWETLPHERLSPRVDTMSRRIWSMHRLTKTARLKAGIKPQNPLKAEIDSSGTLTANSQCAPLRFLVMPIRAALAPINAKVIDYPILRVAVGQVKNRDEIVSELSNLGYERVDIVTARAQFAVRGGLIDVFPPTDPHPVRIEFFGDEIDSIRPFTVSDQRTFNQTVQNMVAPACRELLLDENTRQTAMQVAVNHPTAAEILNLAAQGIYSEGLESLAPLLGAQMVPLFSLFPKGSRLVAIDRLRLESRAEELVETTAEFLAASWSAAASGGEVPLEIETASFLNIEQMRVSAVKAEMSVVSISPFASTDTAINLPVETIPEPTPPNIELISTIGDLYKSGWTTLITTSGPGMSARIKDLLNDKEIPAVITKKLSTEAFPLNSEIRNRDINKSPNPVQIMTAPLSEGFQIPQLGIWLATEAQVLGKRKSHSAAKKTKLPSRRQQSVDPLSLRTGDYVVHLKHGVGRFVKLDKRSIGVGANTTSREYVVLEYAPSKRGGPGDQLWVPTDQLDQLSKYVGGETPSLSKMGGSDWAKTKQKARKAVKDIARELVRLYAARQSSKGFAFSPDTPWQRELENSFEYVETPDQLTTIDEVKADMEQSVPMDRLVCGDVGYGKTEIAVRAAFKAVQDGKQVAVLAPTTLLVSQHLETFQNRFAGFPVTVAALSRFTSAKETKSIKEKLQEGSIEVVIGTHSLLSGTVRFKDLGLIVVDEEQRFGVEHKEALKALRMNVDVLSMSATPIPRTLEMAVTGIRSLSTLTTPPEDRHPVLTYVGAYTDRQVAAAIRRELLRDGQVFYVHNRVQDISKIANHIQQLVPESKVRIAHGQLPEAQLEQVMMDFWNQEFDVLVSTTIVENGLDVTNANTIIVDRADRMGLSQLHQLRGRVGRGMERGYAYFLYPSDTRLSETAFERLKTIGTNTGLGVGMSIASKDLEIRGAGNLLGGEQSGHIAGVGFDLYIRMIGEAVSAYNGNDPSEDTTVSIELPVDAYIPEDYLDAQSLRLDAYTRLSNTQTDEEVDQILEEILDRYGDPLPKPVQRLGDIAKLRNLARKYGLQEITSRGKFVRFAAVELADSQISRLNRLYPAARIKLATRELFIPSPQKTSGLIQTPVVDDELIAWVEKVINTVIKPIK